MKVQLIIEDKSGSTAKTGIATLERGESDELIGLSLEEAKAITASVQRTLVKAQAREVINRGGKVYRGLTAGRRYVKRKGNSGSLENQFSTGSI